MEGFMLMVFLVFLLAGLALRAVLYPKNAAKGIARLALNQWLKRR